MKYIATIILPYFILLSLGCYGDSNRKAIYELEEHCGRTAEQWAKAKSDEVLYYRVHFNSHLNKCLILATLSPGISKSFYSYSELLYDLDENKEYGHHTILVFQNGAREGHQCIIRGKYYGELTAAQAEQKWSEFVKEMMDE